MRRDQADSVDVAAFLVGGVVALFVVGLFVLRGLCVLLLRGLIIVAGFVVNLGRQLWLMREQSHKTSPAQNVRVTADSREELPIRSTGPWI